MHFSVKTIADLFMFGVENDTKFSFIGNNNQPVKRCINDLVFKCIEWLETMVKDTVPFCLWHSVWSPLQGIGFGHGMAYWSSGDSSLFVSNEAVFMLVGWGGHHKYLDYSGLFWLDGLLGTALLFFSCFCHPKCCGFHKSEEFLSLRFMHFRMPSVASSYVWKVPCF